MDRIQRLSKGGSRILGSIYPPSTDPERSRRDSNPWYLSVQWFSRPSCENPHSNRSNGLSKAQSSAYKPAYKKNPKKADNVFSKLPSELTEIIAV
jgi:hypothetical protein